jgi:hypothetical protein
LELFGEEEKAVGALAPILVGKFMPIVVGEFVPIKGVDDGEPPPPPPLLPLEEGGTATPGIGKVVGAVAVLNKWEEFGPVATPTESALVDEVTHPPEQVYCLLLHL